MQSIETELKIKAAELGADDTAFVSSGKNDFPCVIVLFFRYYSAPQPPDGFMKLSPYYIASNRGYHAAEKLAAYIRSLGFYANHDTQIDAKAQALKCGGFIGRNGFYYHREFGSLVCIQTITTDAAAASEPAGSSASGCLLGCRACIDACPSAAVGNVSECIRYHSNLSIPEHLRANLYQLLGCELCQTACPLNAKQEHEAPMFKTSELTAGMHLAQLQELAGKNMARKQRILSQAAVYAANTHQKDTATHLCELSASAPYPVNEHAAWALHKLEEEV